MAFPSTISTFTNPNPTDKLNSPSHSGIETAQNNELVQIEQIIGVAGANSVLGTIITDLRSPASNGGGHIQTVNKGGTGQTTYTKGDILVAQSQSVLGKLSVGADGLALVTDSTTSTGLKYQGVAGATQIQNQQYTYARASVISSSVYGINLSQAVSMLSDGQGFVVKFPTTNTTSVLALQVNATGPSSVAARIKNTDLTNPIVGAIQASMIGIVEFDSVSSVFQLQNTYLPAYTNTQSSFLRDDGQFASIVGVNYDYFPNTSSTFGAYFTQTLPISSVLGWASTGTPTQRANSISVTLTSSNSRLENSLGGDANSVNQLAFGDGIDFKASYFFLNAVLSQGTSPLAGSDVAYWHGFTDVSGTSVTNFADITATTQARIGFAHYNGRIYAVTCSNAAITTTDIQADSANVKRQFLIDFTPSVVNYYINGVLVATHTTNIPTTGGIFPVFGGFDANNANATFMMSRTITFSETLS